MKKISIKELLTKVVDDWKESVKDLSDSELREDRSNWMKIYGRDIDDSYLVNDLEVDVHTIALELEQLSRWNKIYYDDLETMVKDLYNREFVSEKLKDMLKKLQHQFDKEKNVEKRKG